MKSNDLKKIIEEALYNEVKTSIISENKKKEKYHIMCDGKPLASFDSKKEAEVALPKFKKKHHGKKLIIEKALYESYSDMIEYFDKLNDELENENMKNEKNINEGISDEGMNKLMAACEKHGCRKVAQKLVDRVLLSMAGISSSDLPDTSTYANGLDEIESLLENEEWDAALEIAKETASNMLEDEGFGQMEDMMNEQFEDEYYGGDLEDEDEEDPEILKIIGGKDSVKLDNTDDEEIGSDYSDDYPVFDEKDEEEGEEEEEDLMNEQFEDEYYGGDLEDEDEEDPEILKIIGRKDSVKLDKTDDEEIGSDYSDDYPVFDEKDEEEGEEEENEDETEPYDLDVENGEEELDEELVEVKGMCSECGKMLTEEGTMCNECGSLKETNSKKVKMKESDFRNLVKKLVSEAMKGQPGTPGVVGKTVAERSRKASGKDNASHLKDVEKKMKDYLSFDGNTNPEFPKQIGGERMAIHPSKEQADEIAKNKAGLQNLDYDMEPSENFKKRLEAALKGDTKMGNSSVTGKNSVKTSNGAKALDSKEKSGNTIPTETDKFLEKQIKDRKKDKDERELYDRAAVPTKNLSESVNSEINMIKRLTEYNKKTQ